MVLLKLVQRGQCTENKVQTKQEKLDYIQASGIPVREDYDDYLSLDELVALAHIKNFIKVRLKDKVECFGYIDETDPICDKCYLKENGKCKLLQNYLSQSNPRVPVGAKVKVIVFTPSGGTTIKMESIEKVLANLRVRDSSNEKKVARVILESASNNLDFNELLKKICETIDSDNPKLAQTYFYKLRTKLREHCNVRVELFTRKFVSIVEDKSK